MRFAVDVGSPELLAMLFSLTAADLSAVGPGVWDGWKAEIISDLYRRTMQYLAGDAPLHPGPTIPAASRRGPGLARPAKGRSLVRAAALACSPAPISTARRRSRLPTTCGCSTDSGRGR